MTEATVVGGGIIGVSCALALQQSGIDTTLIERDEIGMGASYGNCSLLATGEIVPISEPGVIRHIPGWLFNAEGPLALRPAHLAAAMPWLWRFLLNSRRTRVAEICRGLATLTATALQDYEHCIESAKIEDIWAEHELLYLYDRRAEFEQDRLSWRLRAEQGYRVTELTGHALAELEPMLDTRNKFGLHLHGWRSFTDPLRLTRSLARHFQRLGGSLVNDEVTAIERTGSGSLKLRMRDGEIRPVKKLVLANGAQAVKLLQGVGIRIPLAPLHGYHADIADSGIELSRAIIYASGGFVCTPLDKGLRIGGGIEIAPLDAAPNYRRTEVLVEQTRRRLLPGLNSERISQWMGARPFMPDTLPVIGAVPGIDNFWLALGHGQLGLTLGPTTGKLISALIKGEKPPIDLTPYRVDRRYY